MKHKIGDTIRIKSIDWYNQNKNVDGTIFSGMTVPFIPQMSQYCGKKAKIIEINSHGYYRLDIDYCSSDWSDWMLE